MTTQEHESVKKTRQRSPGYPAIDLETAIARARKLYNFERMHSASINVILNHWGYNPGSGIGLVVLAALIKFGLLTQDGAGDKRKARLTELARKIILDDRPNSPERDAAIQEAALNPKIHRDLWKQYNGVLPSDENLKYELRAVKGFNDSAVSDFIKEFRSTVELAKLTKFVIISDDGRDKTSSEIENKMSPTPQITETDTSIKEKETLIGKPSTVKYCWPLAKNVIAEVIITGPSIGTKDIEMLRKYLEIAKDALQENST